MKVYINRKPVNGPWGGGNRTIKCLIECLKERGHGYTLDVNDDYDVIYCHDPRPDESGIRYEHFLTLQKIKNVKIFQRVGDVFCHRGEQYTQYLKATLKYSDAVSFISEWASEYLECKIPRVL